MSETELNLETVISIIDHSHLAEDRTDEFYAVAQLLALGNLSPKEQKSLGEKLVTMLETDNWWRSNGAFNDI